MDTRVKQDCYVIDKIAHLKRVGLVSNQHTGVGKHGGACPDWLLSEQKEAEKERERRQDAGLWRRYRHGD